MVSYVFKPPSHLFGLSKNQAEPAGMKNFHNSRHIREGNWNPCHTRGGMRQNEPECRLNENSLYNSGHAIRWCSELRPDSFEGQSGRSDCIRAAFERQSKDSDGISSAFQLNSFNIEIDSGSNRNAFEVHSGSVEAHSGHSGRIWSGSPFQFSLECDHNVSNAVGMPHEYLECSQSAIRIHFECRSIFLHFECTSKVLSMSRTFGPATRMGPNIWNALWMQSEFLECTSNIQEYTKNFHSGSFRL